MESGSRPTLLYISHRLPYPTHNGQSVRSYNVLRILAARYRIVALCFDVSDPSRPAMPLSERIGHLAQFGSFEVFPIPQDANPLRRLVDHARSVVAREVFTHFMYDSPEFHRALRQTLASHEFDLVHVESMDLARWLPLLHGLPVVCTHHNVESALLQRRAQAESGWRKAYIALQSRLEEQAERHWLPRVALNVAVSNEDEQTFRRIAPAGRYCVVPNGVDTDYYRPRTGEHNGVVFVGGLNWFPNRDALEWFVAEILGPLRKLVPGVRVRWIGSATESQQAAFAAHGVEVTGFVDDIRAAVTSAACFIAPLRVGGGTRLKLLEAMAMGMAIVSTRVGAEGLAVTHERNILFADEPAAFAAQVCRVLNDPALRASLGLAARETALQTYSWPVVGRQLGEHYASLSRTRAASG